MLEASDKLELSLLRTVKFIFFHNRFSDQLIGLPELAGCEGRWFHHLHLGRLGHLVQGGEQPKVRRAFKIFYTFHRSVIFT